MINAADLADGGKLSLAMPLAFGENAGVTVTNLAGLAKGVYTIAETTGEGNAITVAGTQSFRSRVTTDSAKWKVAVSESGTKLELSPIGGLLLILR